MFWISFHGIWKLNSILSIILCVELAEGKHKITIVIVWFEKTNILNTLKHHSPCSHNSIKNFQNSGVIYKSICFGGLYSTLTQLRSMQWHRHIWKCTSYGQYQLYKTCVQLLTCRHECDLLIPFSHHSQQEGVAHVLSDTETGTASKHCCGPNPWNHIRCEEIKPNHTCKVFTISILYMHFVLFFFFWIMKKCEVTYSHRFSIVTSCIERPKNLKHYHLILCTIMSCFYYIQNWCFIAVFLY